MLTDTTTTFTKKEMEGILGHALAAKIEWVYLAADDRLFHREAPDVWREFGVD